VRGKYGKQKKREILLKPKKKKRTFSLLLDSSDRGTHPLASRVRCWRMATHRPLSTLADSSWSTHQHATMQDHRLGGLPLQYVRINALLTSRMDVRSRTSLAD